MLQKIPIQRSKRICLWLFRPWRPKFLIRKTKQAVIGAKFHGRLSPCPQGPALMPTFFFWTVSNIFLVRKTDAIRNCPMWSVQCRVEHVSLVITNFNFIQHMRARDMFQKCCMVPRVLTPACGHAGTDSKNHMVAVPGKVCWIT